MSPLKAMSPRGRIGNEVFCPFCGLSHVVSGEDLFCVECGTKLPRKAMRTMALIRDLSTDLRDILPYSRPDLYISLDALGIHTLEQVCLLKDSQINQLMFLGWRFSEIGELMRGAKREKEKKAFRAKLKEAKAKDERRRMEEYNRKLEEYKEKTREIEVYDAYKKAQIISLTHRKIQTTKPTGKTTPLLVEMRRQEKTHRSVPFRPLMMIGSVWIGVLLSFLVNEAITYPIFCLFPYAHFKIWYWVPRIVGSVMVATSVLCAMLCNDREFVRIGHFLAAFVPFIALSYFLGLNILKTLVLALWSGFHLVLMSGNYYSIRRKVYHSLAAYIFPMLVLVAWCVTHPIGFYTNRGIVIVPFGMFHTFIFCWNPYGASFAGELHWVMIILFGLSAIIISIRIRMR